MRNFDRSDSTHDRNCDRWTASLCLALASLGLGGCASAPASDGLLGKAMETVGLKVPNNMQEARAARDALPVLQRKVTLRVHAGEQLNSDSQQRSLTVVTRIFKLRRLDGFMSAPYAAFGDPAAERSAFGADLVEAREIIFRPGQRHEVIETMPIGTDYLAVVALFQAPAEGRWRFAFDADQVKATGVTLGLHSCAISVAAGVPERSAPELLRVAGVRCR